MLLFNFFFLVLGGSSSLLVRAGDEEKSNTLSVLMPDAIAHQVKTKDKGNW